MALLRFGYSNWYIYEGTDGMLKIHYYNEPDKMFELDANMALDELCGKGMDECCKVIKWLEEEFPTASTENVFQAFGEIIGFYADSAPHHIHDLAKEVAYKIARDLNDHIYNCSAAIEKIKIAIGDVEAYRNELIALVYDELIKIKREENGL